MVDDPSPSLPAGISYSSELREFCDACLHKDAQERSNYSELEKTEFMLKNMTKNNKDHVASFIKLILE